MTSKCDKVLSIAKQTRTILEILVIKNRCNNFVNGPTLCGYCGVGSIHIQNLAKTLGINVDLCQGVYQSDGHRSGHCWIEYDGKIIDVTGTQFYKDICSPIHVTSTYDDAYVIITKNSQARRILAKWPVTQNYKTYQDDLVQITYHLGLEMLRKFESTRRVR